MASLALTFVVGTPWGERGPQLTVPRRSISCISMKQVVILRQDSSTSSSYSLVNWSAIIDEIPCAMRARDRVVNRGD